MSRTRANGSSRSGSHAGRGFRFQDAVAAWYVVRGWQDAGSALVLPEGEDDVELRDADGVHLIQVKSRREGLGPHPITRVVAFVKELWDRAEGCEGVVGLVLVLERPVAGCPVAPPVDGAAIVAMNDDLQRRLERDGRASSMLPRTRIVVLGSPFEAATEMVRERLNCHVAAAAFCVAEIRARIGALADVNGEAPVDRREGLSASDTDAVLTATLDLFDVAAIEEAVASGAVEPVDFVTPLHDRRFHLGVDVEPGHLAAGLVFERPDDRDAVLRGLEERRSALVVGPSGAGKSAVMWGAARSLRHAVRWYRVRHLDEADLPALRRLLRAVRASPTRPVGLILDDVGRRTPRAWDRLSELASSTLGILLLGSIREEDVFRLERRASTAEVRPVAGDELAQRMWTELRAQDRTEWPGWREPWRRSEGLLLEYVHVLTRGDRLCAVVGDQVDDRLRDPDREVEFDVLRVAAFAHSAGASVEVERLVRRLGRSDAAVGRALRRLVDEHLVRAPVDGLVDGLHQLRSEAIRERAHAVPPPTRSATLAHAVHSVPSRDLAPLAFQALSDGSIDEGAVLDALADRLAGEPDPVALAAVLRGLGDGLLAATAARWLETPEAKALPPTLLTLAVMSVVANMDMSFFDGRVPLLPPAVRCLKALRGEVGRDPRRRLLERIPTEPLTAAIETASPGDLTAVLDALIGGPTLPAMSHLHDLRPPLLDHDLGEVAELLTAASVVDRSLARAWVDAVGQDVLLARVGREVAWTGPASTAETEDGLSVSCDYHHAVPSHQPDPHGDVVQLCELLLALCPAADLAASRALRPDGRVAGFKDIPLAHKRIPRPNLPGQGLVAWNRRLMAATATRVAAASQSDFLRRAATILRDATPLLEKIFDGVLRARVPTDEQIAQLGALHEDAGGLTPHGSAPIGMLGTEEVASVNDLQHVLHEATADVVRRFAGLPDKASAYAASLADLIQRLEKAAREEPWELLEGDVSPHLRRLAELLRDLRDVASEAGARKERPAVTWRDTVRRGRRNNGLSLVATKARQVIGTRNRRLAAKLRGVAADAGLTVEVHPIAAPGGPSWPPSEVAVAFRTEDMMSAAELVGTAVEALRPAIDPLVRLTLVPVVDGFATPQLGLAGHQTLLPLMENADSAVAAIGAPRLPAPITSAFSRAASAAIELAGMDACALGLPGRPSAEEEVRARLEAVFEEAQATHAAMLSAMDETLIDKVRALLARLRDGSLQASAMIDALEKNECSDGGLEMAGATITLLSLDLMAARSTPCQPGRRP